VVCVGENIKYLQGDSIFSMFLQKKKGSYLSENPVNPNGTNKCFYLKNGLLSVLIKNLCVSKVLPETKRSVLRALKIIIKFYILFVKNAAKQKPNLILIFDAPNRI